MPYFALKRVAVESSVPEFFSQGVVEVWLMLLLWLHLFNTRRSSLNGASQAFCPFLCQYRGNNVESMSFSFSIKCSTQ